ncbi:MAG TPA: Lcl C-terminal domain-containing protein [Candidatus Wunengus sp. YC60]|uniref:Lcl C-terminal domain-containing protein n=1 Tax=Candidatus Wunengus sp. YC60 TaxID=3367697 RepID=UPI004027CACA
MQNIPHKNYFNTIQRLKNWRFSFVPGNLFPIIIGWVVISLVHNKAAVSEPERAAHSVYASAALRATPEEALSPEVVQTTLREKGLFDSRRNAAGHGVSHKYEMQKNGKVVYDHVSCLMWQQAGSQHDMNYRDAKNYISALNKDRFAGYNDWRLPTLEEAISLMEPAKKDGDLHIDPVFDPCQKRVWTSDFRKDGMAWVVWFDSGFCDYTYTDNNIRHYVRAVRVKRDKISERD